MIVGLLSSHCGLKRDMRNVGLTEDGVIARPRFLVLGIDPTTRSYIKQPLSKKLSLIKEQS